jgi:hypothetical protein
MFKTKKTALIILPIIFFLIAGMLRAFATGSQNETGFLHNASLYFFKDLRRVMEKLLAFSYEDKIMIDLKFLAEKGRELEKSFQNQRDIGDTEVFHGTLSKYNESLTALEKKITDLIKKKNNSSNNYIFHRVFWAVLDEAALIDQLKKDYRVFEDDFAKIQQNLREIGFLCIGFVEAPGEVNYQAYNLLRNFRLIAVLSQWEETSPSELAKKLRRIKNELIWRFEGYLKIRSDSDLDLFFNKLDLLNHQDFSVFEELRQWFQDQNLKSRFNAARLNLLEVVDSKNLIKEEEARGMIIVAETKIKELEDRLPREQIATENPQQFLEQAILNFEQAQKLRIDQRYGASLSQALTARAIAESGLGQLEILSNLGQETKLSRLEFDKLKKEAKINNKMREENPLLYFLFDQAELLLLNVRGFNELKSAKIIFGEIEALLTK